MSFRRNILKSSATNFLGIFLTYVERYVTDIAKQLFVLFSTIPSIGLLCTF